MDDTTLAAWLKILVLVFTALAVKSVLGESLIPIHSEVEFEYLSPDQEKALEKTFDQGSFKTPMQLNGRWTCEMYGVLSRMQVQRGVELYDWTLKDGAWTNSGAQPVTTYKIENGKLLGVQSRFEDQVKFTNDGKLVSRLSVLTPQRMVVAYALCTNQKKIVAATP